MAATCPKPKVSRWIGTLEFQRQSSSSTDPSTAPQEHSGSGLVNKGISSAIIQGNGVRKSPDRSLRISFDDFEAHDPPAARNNTDGAMHGHPGRTHTLTAEPAAVSGSESNFKIGTREHAGLARGGAEHGMLPRASNLSSSGSETAISNGQKSREGDWPLLSNIGHPTETIIPGPEHFRPSRMVLERQGLVKIPLNPRSNYLGDYSSISSARQILNLPSNENCALWLTCLPPDISLETFLSRVRTGAVYAAVLMRPEGKHWTTAAKLVFKRHSAAAKFLQQTQSVQGIVFSGLRMRAFWNRVGYRENNTKRTRVLRLSGPPEIMNPAFWNEYFQKCVVFELEGFREIGSQDKGEKVLEFRFARVDGQSEALLRAITSNTTFAGIVGVQYGLDPCDPESIC